MVAASKGLREHTGLWLGLAAFFSILFFTELDADNPSVTPMAAVAALMAIWWMTEALSLAVTSMLPVVLFPLLGIMKAGDVAPAFMNSNIFLFAGGFMLALAMERWNLHKRIALIVLVLIGGQTHRIVLGFMIATAVMSMWVSNTATTMMMLPMALSLVALYESMNREAQAGGEGEGGGGGTGATPDPRASNFPLVLMLSIAYAASIGGMGTIIGTPPNVVLVSIFQEQFPDAPPISFAQWFFFAAPLSIVFLIITWALLTRFIYPLPKTTPFSGKGFIRDEFKKLGPIKMEELQVMTVFTVTALLWIFRREIRFGESFAIPGWSSFLEFGDKIDDGTVAIAAGVLLFLLPASKAQGGGKIMNWNTAKKLPWEILILFGGGFALAKGFGASGLSNWIGGKFEFLEGAPPWAMIATVGGTINLITEVTSNTATTQMILPILASLAVALQLNPLLLMIPAALGASFAFMLPVATPPNAIIYGSGHVPIGKMIRAGVLLNLIGLILATIFVLTLGLPIFDIDPSVFPEWARQAAPTNSQ